MASTDLKKVINMLTNKKILLCVTGGIAVYKAVDLTSKLTQQGADVKVIMSTSATKFVTPLTFQAISRHDVYTDTFDEKDPQVIAHIDLADWADIVIIAPATANIIGKMALGIGDDMVTTTLLASAARVPTYIAPAMNVHMYNHPAVAKNMKTLERRGYYFIEPGEGYLACGYVGKGRLEEPETIVQVIKTHEQREQLLKGQHILITAGPTRETIDPVRFFTNRSSGKMGFALAEAAATFGANVTLVTGPVQLTTSHPNINRVDVTTADEMYEAVLSHYNHIDIVIKAAAVADYRPKITYNEKMKKQTGELSIVMERTKDILQELGERKTTQYLVGFAAETTNVLANGQEKLQRKNLDAIVVNDVSEAGAGFAGETNKGTFIKKNLQTIELPLTSKQAMAEQILRLIIEEKDETP